MTKRHTLAEEIARAVNLREGAEGVERLLHHLAGAERGISTKALARRIRLPLPVVAAIRRELEKRGIVERRPSGMALSPEGMALSSPLSPPSDLRCPRCDGGGIVIPERLAPLSAAIEAAFARRPPPRVELDQSKCLPETALRRVLYLHAETDPGRVLVLGDDDFFSVALGLYAAFLGGSRNLEIVVVEVDPRIASEISSIAAEEGLPIRVVEHDLRIPLPSALRNRFEVVETDPPYTIAGLDLFLQRGVEGLSAGGGRTLLLSFAHESPEETLAMHERFLRHRLALRAILPGFNRYEGAEILGNSGQLIHLQTTRETLPPSSRAYEGPLYTHEVRPHRGQYRCAACGARVETARGRPISTWKQRGCPACGARTFRREKRRR